jgi:hypothetical protein
MFYHKRVPEFLIMVIIPSTLPVANKHIENEGDTSGSIHFVEKGVHLLNLVFLTRRDIQESQVMREEESIFPHGSTTGMETFSFVWSVHEPWEISKEEGVS